METQDLVSEEDRHKMIGTHYHVMWHVPTGLWACSLGLQLVALLVGIVAPWEVRLSWRKQVTGGQSLEFIV